MDNKQIFSNNLNYYLARNAKTAGDLINDLGYKKTTVYAWLNGSTFPRADKLSQIADYLGISTSDLLSDNKTDTLHDAKQTNNSSDSFAERMKFLRKTNRETQKDLASFLNISQSSINAYESGTSEPSNETLIKLANHFHVSTDYLLTGQNKKDFTQEQVDAFKDEAIQEDTQNMAAHSTNKDVSARGLNPKAIAQVMDDYLSSPEGQEHLRRVIDFDGFDVDNNDVN